MYVYSSDVRIELGNIYPQRVMISVGFTALTRKHIARDFKECILQLLMTERNDLLNGTI